MEWIRVTVSGDSGEVTDLDDPSALDDQFPDEHEEHDELDLDLPVLHNRTYRVRAYRQSDTELRIRGSVKDVKPPGIYIPIDTEPLTIHHMVVDLVIGYPSLEITDASVVFETHPHATCPTIADHYENLVGLSIARGFTHRVRELFGGPRGCTHTTALLQAMAPVAIQSIWSMRSMAERDGGVPVMGPRAITPEQRRAMLEMNRNTCHVWSEDGEHFQRGMRGELVEPPIWGAERLRRLGVDPADWYSTGAAEQ